MLRDLKYTIAGAALALAISAGAFIPRAFAAAPVTVCNPSQPNVPGNCETVAASNFATNQATVGTSTAILVPARVGRQSVTVVSNCTSQIEVGGSNALTTSNGLIIAGVVGATLTLNNYNGPIYAVATSSCPVSYSETY